MPTFTSKHPTRGMVGPSPTVSNGFPAPVALDTFPTNGGNFPLFVYVHLHVLNLCLCLRHQQACPGRRSPRQAVATIVSQHSSPHIHVSVSKCVTFVEVTPVKIISVLIRRAQTCKEVLP